MELEDEEEAVAVVEAAAMRMNGRGTCRLCLCRDLLCARCAKSFLGHGAAAAARGSGFDRVAAYLRHE
ncbi:uncharacterized protein A4U43_C05F33470 [Asparagus officinalis]|uniref:Uncharacterized protein n=1 Tax=Asparagus officinalis TaxID=4686 RepID=A0A5P1EWF3_ASPOF|nr:uncharacterized protein A4U43_C05F33470 [Asparagus officinalis]